MTVTDGVILPTTKKKTESIITNYAMQDVNHTVRLKDDANDNDNDNDNEDDGIIKVRTAARKYRKYHRSN